MTRLIALFLASAVLACSRDRAPEPATRDSAQATASPRTPNPSSSPPSTNLDPFEALPTGWWKRGDSACPHGGKLGRLAQIGGSYDPPGGYYCWKGDPGTWHGPYVHFHSNGRPHRDGWLLEGQDHGLSHVWDENGKLLSRWVYDRGRLQDRWPTEAVAK